MDKCKINETFNMVREAMLIVGFSVNYRGIPAVVCDDCANTSHYLLKTHTVVLKDGYGLAHELCHSLQTYETMAANQEKGWYARDCEQQAMAIEMIEGIGIEKIKELIAVIGNQWTSREMFSWVSYFFAVLKNKTLSKMATKPFHLSVSKRKALNALTDALIKKD